MADQPTQKSSESFLEMQARKAERHNSRNLRVVRVVNRINEEDRHNKQPPNQVEDAFALTLKNEGINLPVDSLLKITEDFKPKEK